MTKAECIINGQVTPIDLNSPHKTLLDCLREECKLTGTKEGCNEGDCGACTVMISDKFDGKVRHRAVNACILFMPQLIGKEIITVEGLTQNQRNMHPVQEAMVNYHGSQCGFCTPGIVLSLVAAHTNGEQNYNDVLAGNLCRCTGYAPIIRAAEDASNQPIPHWIKQFENQISYSTNSAKSPKLFVPKDINSFAEWYNDNPDALIVAGATDVGLWVTKQLLEPELVCFVGQLEELSQINVDKDWIHIGATTNLTKFKETIDRIHPSFGELLRRFGSVQVRNSATIGGNIANGSPIGDSAPALIALGAELTLRRRSQRRNIMLEDFFLDYQKQDRKPGEFVESIRIPVQPDNLQCYKLSKRFDQDISAVCGCFNIKLNEGRVNKVRIAFGGMAVTPKRATMTEQALIGHEWNRKTIEQAMTHLENDFSPISDMRASKEYRIKTARNMLLKTFLHDQNSSNGGIHDI